MRAQNIYVEFIDGLGVMAEQVFLNRPVGVTGARPGAEARWFAVGRTDRDRLLTVVFTIRGRLLRVISARPMSRAERNNHGQATRA